MPGPIHEQVVVITGASSGVGRACARAFAQRGARLALIARNEEALEVAAEEARNAGAEALVLSLDVADSEAVEAAADQIVERFGRIDTWVNNAMVTVFAPVMRMTAAEFRRVTEVTYLGYVHGTVAALRHMLPRDEGTIIQIGSALAYRSIPLQSAYCAAKAAIRGFTDSLRSELIHDGSSVKLSMLQLPAINTPQVTRQRNKMKKQSQPVPPMLAPELIAETVVWAAEHAPREMLVGGSVVKAVWGQKFIPGLLDIYLGKTNYDAQLTDISNDPDRPDILFDTLPGDPGAHGPYRDKEHRQSWQIWARTHPQVIGGMAGALATGLALGLAAFRRA